MSDNQEEEPSIEEILTSIRQIISDDDEDAPAEDAAVEEPQDEPEDVIELTEKADPEHIEKPEPVIDEIEDDFEDEPVAAEPEQPEEDPMEIDLQDRNDEPEVIDDIGFDDSDTEDDALLTDRAEEAALGAFKELAAKTAIDSISGVTIEQIVREELRPMLRVWLDSNLPSLVQRLVQEELDRVARRALDD